MYYCDIVGTKINPHSALGGIWTSVPEVEGKETDHSNNQTNESSQFIYISRVLKSSQDLTCL